MLWQDDFIAEELEQFDSGDACIEIVEIGEFVAEQMDAADGVSFGLQRFALGEPLVQRHVIESRHRAVRMESDEAVDDASQHGRLQNGIVQPWG